MPPSNVKNTNSSTWLDLKTAGQLHVLNPIKNVRVFFNDFKNEPFYSLINEERLTTNAFGGT